MLKRIFESALASLVMSAITLLMTFVFSTYLSKDGEIRIGNAIEKSNGKHETNIVIINASHGYINGLDLQVQGNVSPDSILTSDAISIVKASTNHQNTSIITLSKIKPNSKTTIVIPTNKQDDGNISAINANDKKLSIELPNETYKRWETALWMALLSSALFFVITTLDRYRANVAEDKRIASLNTEAARLEKNIEQLKEEKDGFRGELNSLRNNLTKYSILMRMQTKDYEKELEFWKNVIRSLLYDGDKKFTEANHLIETVTNSLKTYQTKKINENDFDRILFISKELESNTKKE